jgi:hypothetical protein
MAKTELIIVRVDLATKERLSQAAARLGKSLTTFLLEAADKAARKAEAMPAPMLFKPKGKGACPTYFVGCCNEAAQGGAGGYFQAGYTLATHIGAAMPYELDEDEEAAELEQLSELLLPADPEQGGLRKIRRELRDDGALLAWLEKNVPRCLALIPARRRKQFVAGFYAAADDDAIDWD